MVYGDLKTALKIQPIVVMENVMITKSPHGLVVEVLHQLFALIAVLMMKHV